jgi:hypothetical protein
MPARALTVVGKGTPRRPVALAGRKWLLLAVRLLALEQEITDAFVNLLIAAVRRIGARYRSQPPRTGSIEATEAMTSASMPPVVRTGAACRLTKDGSRRCAR